MNLWHNPKKEGQKENTDEFQRFIRRNPDVVFHFPNYSKAPWHVQALFHGVTFNFWPHLMRGNIDRTRAVNGVRALDELIEGVRRVGSETFDVMEDFE